MIKHSIHDAAIRICAIAASTPDLYQAYGAVWRSLYGKTRNWTETPIGALALAAWSACQYSRSGNVDAEAEALLRSGWSPGEPVTTRTAR